MVLQARITADTHAAFLKFIFLVILKHMYACASVCGHVHVSAVTAVGDIRPHGAVVTGSCESPHTGDGTGTLVFCKSR